MRHIEVGGYDVAELRDGWQAAATAPDACVDPRELPGRSLDWLAASVPGTAAGALFAAGLWRPGDDADLDRQDWWFRTRFHADPAGASEDVVLRLDGIATIAEVFVNGVRVLDSDSMFAGHVLEVGHLLRGDNELAICCRALGPVLDVRRRPRARWRTRLVSHGNLRFHRTMLIGRAPGFAPGPPVVGPWRAVRLERRRVLAFDRLELRTRVEGRDGVLTVRARARGTGGGAPPDRVTAQLSTRNGTHRAALAHTDTRAGAGVVLTGEVVVPGVELWWPHTHGGAALHALTLHARTAGEEVTVAAGQIGFRTLQGGEALERDGLQLRVNGVPVFARGAVWTPLHGGAIDPSADELRGVLQSACAAGMNMIRVPGIACYETEAFYNLCDELGILVWQDFMFANLDYPEEDPDFIATVRREAEDVLETLGGRPSLAVLCGGSEVAQQVAMLGLDPALASGRLFGGLLPSLVAESALDAVYVPSAPWGGERPFSTNRGVANYYGVGGYRRPLEDVRRAEVRFAAECLAFSNVPDEQAIELLQTEAAGGLAVHHPRWKAGVPRDAGAGWDFEDVRDHYLAELFALDPGELRRTDHDRYLELSRTLTGELMAEVLGEWRRSASPCTGALVLWLSDLAPGAGWGLLDDRGRPKVAYHHVRRALAPIAVWSTDEGLDGVLAHVANDTADAIDVRLRVSLYRDLEVPVGEASMELRLAPHSGCAHDLEMLLGRFVDVSWAYRFGPPAQDLIVLSLEREADAGAELLSQSFRLPAGRPLHREPAARLGLSADAYAAPDGALRLVVRSERFAYGVRAHLPGCTLEDDAFSVEPGGERAIEARRVTEGSEQVELGIPHLASVTALNLAGRVRVGVKDA